MRIFVAGDTHGNLAWVVNHLYPLAARLDADMILVLGDFGWWEHTMQGVTFLNFISDTAQETGIPLAALRGNHDNLARINAWYGNKPRGIHGFVKTREGVYFIPDGHLFEIDGVKLRAFGGAYSVDKQRRLEEEGRRTLEAAEQGVPKDHRGTLWFPEEELTPEQFKALMDEYSGPVDVVLSHDRPFGANSTGLKDIPECHPNQRRLQEAMNVHRPQWWLHGHLHFAYQEEVRCGDDDRYTTVVGLACDSRAAPRFWRSYHAWGLLDLHEGVAEWVPGWTVQQALDNEDDDTTVSDALAERFLARMKVKRGERE